MKDIVAHMENSVARISSNISVAVEEEDSMYSEDSFDLFAEKDEIIRTRFGASTSYNIGDFFPIFDEELQESEVPVHSPQNDEPYIL
ncbi:hypothetical protein MKX03_007490, partial [Papaver bracteatum]